MAIIRAIIAGERDPKILAAKRHHHFKMNLTQPSAMSATVGVSVQNKSIVFINFCAKVQLY
jgi:hypothetical protein